jgi:uncharacterized LabA/DUF88 family protein
VTVRSHCAVYVDVGYLLASAATRVTGTSLRSGVEVAHAELIESIMNQAVESSGLPVLRVNWYDSGGGRGGTPDREQEQIGLLPRVKLRLGRLSHAGEQKGVDLKIGLDLVTHARNNAVDVMFLLSGDDDLTEAVEEAQAHGIEVVLLAVPVITAKPHAVSQHLLRAADRLELIDEKAIDANVTVYVREMFRQPDGRHRAQSEPAAVATTPGDTGDTGPRTPSVRPTEPPEASEPAASTQPAPAEQTTEPPAPVPVEVVLEHRAEEPPAASATSDRPSAPPPPPSRPPTPAVMPRKLSAPVPPPAAAAAPRPVLVHQSVTGRPSGGWFETVDPAEEERLVDEVCAGVLDSWIKRAGDDERAGLLDNEPTIPGDIDRALLIDLSTRLNSYALDEPTRHILRSRFWAVARRKLGSGVSR